MESEAKVYAQLDLSGIVGAIAGSGYRSKGRSGSEVKISRRCEVRSICEVEEIPTELQCSGF